MYRCCPEHPAILRMLETGESDFPKRRRGEIFDICEELDETEEESEERFWA